ncbi:MAG: M55 family metallopeptidase [Spirochaetes bacterium]|nr:M55 family metallopeptidase [Spirochaetota bacterium]
MKKLFLSADIEGTCGIADWKETELENSQGAYFRAEMTKEVAAACEAAFAAGAEEILVKDAHSTGRNIDPSFLPEKVKILRSWTRDPQVMMAGLDSNFDGAMFTGYHSAAGSDGNPLAHTMNGGNVWVKINGVQASEFLINSYTSISLGVPVLFLSGDEALCSFAEGLGWGMKTAAVSRGVGNASISVHPSVAQRMIREGVAAVLADPPTVAKQYIPRRFDVEIRFKEHHLAYRGSFFPGAQKLSSHEVAFSASSWKDALVFLFFVL